MPFCYCNKKYVVPAKEADLGMGEKLETMMEDGHTDGGILVKTTIL